MLGEGVGAMRLALAAILAFSPLAASAAPPAPPAAAPTAVETRAPLPGLDRMNRFSQREGCRSYGAQIADATKRRGATRLDQLPPGYAFLAVDRHVGGCHDVTFVNDAERLRNVESMPGASPNP
jgi:hypothetical protein